MLKLHVPKAQGKEYWDAKNRQFVHTDPFEGFDLELEHSLFSISKWEAEWCIPWLRKEEKTPEQMLYYIKCMTVTENVPDIVYENLTEENVKEIMDYLGKSHSAIKFPSHEKEGQSKYRGGMTSEELYASMVLGRVPFECQYWNFDRLVSLLECVGRKQNPGKKMSQADLMRRNSNLNKARRAKHNTRG